MTPDDIVESRTLTQFQQATVIIAIRELFRKSHFDICVVKSLGEVLGTSQKMAGREFEALRLMHCIHWADMGPELAREVKQKVLEYCDIVLTVEDIMQPNQSTAPDKEPEKERTIWQRLLSKS